MKEFSMVEEKNAKPTHNSQDLEGYLQFTLSPTRNREARTQDYEKLLQMPGLRSISTSPFGVLLAETDKVYIQDPGTLEFHTVGSFLIFLVRKRLERVWDIDFKFINQDTHVGCCHHPHIKDNGDYLEALPDNRIPVARLCINDGQDGIYSAIREARIPYALERLLDILHTYHPSNPFTELRNWPVRTSYG